jgi:DNA-binding NarL/FixJ family response regulator
MTMAGHSEGDFRQELDKARGVRSLANEGTDPLVYGPFLSVYCHCLTLGGRYEESLENVAVLSRLAASYGMDHQLTLARYQQARALVGLRRFAHAARVLDVLERGGHFLTNIPFERVRLHMSVGDLKRALDVLASLPSMPARPSREGELLGRRALVHAALGESEQALELAPGATVENDAVQNKVLAWTSEALVAADADDADTTADRLALVVEAGIWDPVVIAVRAAPRFGAFIVDQTPHRGWLQELLNCSADRSLARLLGLQAPRVGRRSANLTPREAEVHELLGQGLTNKKIAELLHISPSTATVHVKHIFEKLGVRSRAEAARALIDESEPRHNGR